MKRITKITIVLVLMISFASCQSSKTGCYDFSSVESKSTQSKLETQKTEIKFTNLVCKP